MKFKVFNYRFHRDYHLNIIVKYVIFLCVSRIACVSETIYPVGSSPRFSQAE